MGRITGRLLAVLALFFLAGSFPGQSRDCSANPYCGGRVSCYSSADCGGCTCARTGPGNPQGVCVYGPKQ